MEAIAELNTNAVNLIYNGNDREASAVLRQALDDLRQHVEELNINANNNNNDNQSSTSATTLTSNNGIQINPGTSMNDRSRSIYNDGGCGGGGESRINNSQPDRSVETEALITDENNEGSTTTNAINNHNNNRLYQHQNQDHVVVDTNGADVHQEEEESTRNEEEDNDEDEEESEQQQQQQPRIYYYSTLSTAGRTIHDVGDCYLNGHDMYCRPFHIVGRINRIDEHMSRDPMSTMETCSILLYNLGLVYHRIGAATGNTTLLYKALELYKQSYTHLQQAAAAIPKAICTNFLILYTAICYNTLQIVYNGLYDIEQTTDYLSLFEYATLSLEIHMNDAIITYLHNPILEDPNLGNLHYFRLRLSLYKMNHYLHYAPAA